MNKRGSWRELFLSPRAHESGESLRLERFFISTCFVTAIFASGYCFMSIYMRGPLFAEAMVTSILIFTMMPFLLKAGIRLSFLVNGFLAVIAIVAICLIYWEGGIRRANVSPWVMVLPAFAMMLQGTRSAFIWLLIALSIIGVFSYFTFTGVTFPIMFDVSKDSLFSILSMSGLVCLITFIFFISERERKKAHESLQSQNITLDKLSKEKTKFLQIAAHDLRNPLIVIQGLASQAADPDITTAERVACLNHIITSADRMSELIKNLLEIEVIDAGKMTINLQPVSLTDLIHSYTAQMAHILSVKKTRVEVNIAAGNISIISDPARIEQILDNYVSNAIKYSPIGSKVLIQLSEINAHVELKVIDEGPGIRKDEIPKLFKQFSTVSSIPRSGEHATGLGLAIVKKIADALRAEVGCTSEPGKGCSFYVRFPKDSVK